MSKKIAKELGLGVGISSGANFLAAVQIQDKLNKNVVTVFPDDLKKYLSTDLSKEIKIEEDDNIETLSNKLSVLGSKMIIKYLEDIIKGNIKRIKQDSSKASFARIIKRIDEHLDFNVSNRDVYNKFRALSPNPLPNFIMDDAEFKIAECQLCDEEGNASEIISEGKDYFVIGCASGSIKVTKIKPSGKNVMSVRDFKNGYGSLLGKVLK